MDIHSELKLLDASHLDAILEIETSVHKNPWSKKLFLEEFSGSLKHNLGLFIEGKLVGYIFGQVVAGELSILNLAVSSKEQRNGYGEKLTQGLVDLAITMGCQSVFLEVRESNFAAIELYKKLAFEAFSERVNYYLDSGENALIMKKCIT